MVAAMAVAVAASLFGLVAAHVLLAQGQFRLQRLDGQADSAQERYERLRLEVANLEAPGRIVAVAQERLAMVAPAGVTYLSPTGPVTGETPARAAAAVAPDAPDDTDTTAAWSGVKRQLGRRP
ncbi:MAG: hypothetical protein ACRDZW_09535 [Acidimicrobiales bacterium]